MDNDFAIQKYLLTLETWSSKGKCKFRRILMYWIGKKGTSNKTGIP